MVVCKNCNKENSLDSRFCRSCGVGLSDAELQTERQKLEDLVAEGYRQFSAGQTEDALLIAQSAVTQDPAHSSARSLMGMAFERQGRIAEALECYEQVLDLNPDSALDRIKVTQLRNALTAHLKEAPTPNRRAATVGALAAAALIICVGAAAAIWSNSKGDPVAEKDNQLVASNEAAGFDPLHNGQPETKQNPGVGTQPPINQPNSNENGASNQGNNGSGANGGSVSPYRGTQLPNAGPNGGPIVPPITFREVPPPDSRNNQGNQGNQNNQNNPGGNKGNTDEVEPKIDPIPKEDPGVIVIKRSGGGTAPALGGSQDVEHRSEGQILLRSASDQFLAGRYDGAAQLYEKAIRSGMGSGSIHQRLGQCYDNLGRKGDALAAFTNAIASYEAAIRNGDTSNKTQSALDSCRQALRALQGG